jgi:hypothetical protein
MVHIREPLPDWRCRDRRFRSAAARSPPGLGTRSRSWKPAAMQLQCYEASERIPRSQVYCHDEESRYACQHSQTVFDKVADRVPVPRKRPGQTQEASAASD